MEKNRIEKITVTCEFDTRGGDDDWAWIDIEYENGEVKELEFTPLARPADRVERVVRFANNHDWKAEVKVGAAGLAVVFVNPLIVIAEWLRDEGYIESDLTSRQLARLNELYHAGMDEALEYDESFGEACNTLGIARHDDWEDDPDSPDRPRS